DALTVEYRAFGLPLPPASAKLIAYPFNDNTKIAGKWEPWTYGLAFLGKSGGKKDLVTVLEDTRQSKIRPSPDLAVVDPEPAFFKATGKTSKAGRQFSLIEKLLDEGRLYFVADGLPFAIQCQARGWNA